MKLLRIILTLDPAFGGPVEGIRRQSVVLDRHGVSTTVATLDPADAPFLSQYTFKTMPLGVTSPRWRALRKFIPWMRYAYSPHFVPWLKRHARDYDAVIVHGLFSYATLGARRALVGSGLNYFVIPHGSLDPWFREHYPRKHIAKQLLWPFCEGPLMNNAKAVLFTTAEEQALAHGTFWPWRIRPRVIPYGTGDAPPVDAGAITAFRTSLPGLGDRPYLLFLSRLHPKKGCDVLIEAFARCSHVWPEIHLVMAGPDQIGWKEELQTRAAVLGIADRVHWTGMITGDWKWAAYHGADAFVLPSHSENFGIVVAEALACGRPVLISDKVNIWREIAQDGAGIVEPDTVEGARTAIARFLSMTKEQRSEMGVAARRCFSERFWLEKTALNLKALFKELAINVNKTEITSNHTLADGGVR